MGKKGRPWQDTEYVLAFFGKTVPEARRNLQEHVSKWSEKGRCPELTGGGLIRSAGGWHAVKEAYRDGIRLTSDERILGKSEFVETTLKQSEEAYDRRRELRSAGIDLSSVIAAACRHLKIDEKALGSTTRRFEIARARALISHIATQELSTSGSEVARRSKVDRSAVSGRYSEL
jgi:putative transposase